MLWDFPFFVSLSRIFFSLIFLWLVPLCLLCLSLNCTLQCIFINSCLDDCNHPYRPLFLPFAHYHPLLHTWQIWAQLTEPYIVYLAPALFSSLILTGFLASHIMSPSFAVLWNASERFHMLFLLSSTLSHPSFWKTSNPSLRQNLGKYHLLRKCYSEPHLKFIHCFL